MLNSNCYIQTCGGVGNQLFQIATAFSYARTNDKNLVICSQDWTASQGRSPMEYSKTLYSNFKLGYADGRFFDFNESQFNFQEIPKVKRNIRLNGYFQTLKYFENDAEEFIKLLNIPKVDSFLLDEKNVAFHIRRGDYLHYKNIHHVCDTNYFNRMFEEFKGYQINVFTDSPNIIAQEFKDKDYNLIQSSDELRELSFMSMHKNIVCSNSSFSWWASLIGNMEKVYVPDRWFADGRTHSDIFRDDMIKLKTR